MTAGKRVALIRPRYNGEDSEFQEPLGAEAICGYLREKGVDARVFDRMLGAGIHTIEEFDPDWTGFSLMTSADVPDALRLQQMLLRDGRRFFAGGLFVTTNPEQARALFPKETVLIPGEGEGPVYELVTTGNVLGKLAPGPDEWAFASRDNLGEYLSRGGVINIRTSRGCRGACRFCTTPDNGRPSGHEARSVEKVADEMQMLAREGFEPIFNFTDDMFGSHERITALEEALDRRNVRAAFTLEMRAQEVLNTPGGAWKQLHQGGLCRVFTGLESFNPETLKGWNKPLPAEKLMASVREIREAGIACEVGYILWHDRTEAEDASLEAELLYRGGLLSPKTALSRLVVFRGSQLYDPKNREDMYLCELKPEAEMLHQKWEELLMPLMPMWNAASCALPRKTCEAFLHESARQAEQELEGCLEEMQEMTRQALMTEKCPDEEDCGRILEKLRGLQITGTVNRYEKR